MENKTDILNDQSEDNKTQYINSERYKYIIFFYFYSNRKLILFHIFLDMMMPMKDNIFCFLIHIHVRQKYQ